MTARGYMHPQNIEDAVSLRLRAARESVVCALCNTLQFGRADGGCITSLQRSREITEPPPSSSFRHPHTLISIITCNSSTTILYYDAERHCEKSFLKGVE